MDPENDNGTGNDAGETGGGINPAWNDLLGAIPEEHHQAVIPHLQQWDSGVQDRFQKVQSEWNDFGFLKENEITPEDTRVALGVLRAIQEDPRSVYDSIGESYGYVGEGNSVETEGENTGQGDAGIQGLPDGFLDEFNRMKSGYETMAQILLDRQKADEEAEQDRNLQQEMDSLKKQHGNFNEQFVTAQMLSGMSAEDAVKAYKGLVENILEENSRPPAPRLLGNGGGGIPGEKPLDPTKLDSAQTKKLVADYLAAHNRANQ